MLSSFTCNLYHYINQSEKKNHMVDNFSADQQGTIRRTTRVQQRNIDAHLLKSYCPYWSFYMKPMMAATATTTMLIARV